MTQVELKVPPKSPYVGVVRLALSALGRGAGLDEETVDDLKIAASEACATAVLAAEASGSSDDILVLWMEGEDRLAVEVLDRASRAGPTSDPEADDLSTRVAMSAALLETLVDSCEVEPLEDGGLRTRLVLHRARRPA